MSVLYDFWRAMLLHLWQTTLVLALVFLLDRALRHAPSRATHTLWTVGLLKLFLPLSIFGAISNGLFRAAGGTSLHGGPEIRLLPVVAVVFDPIGNPGAPESGSPLSHVLVAATACWAAIAVCLMSRAIMDMVRAGRNGGAPIATLDTDQSRRLTAILDGVGVPRRGVILCERFAMPAVVGLLRPRILISECFAMELSDEELRAIFLHEETHRRRHDPLRAALWRIGLALFFFYPLLYPILRRLRATAEFACDESVVHSGIPAGAYERALVQTIKLGLASPAFATAAAAGGALLRQRIKRLPTLNPRRYEMRLQYRVLIAVAALVVGCAAVFPPPMQAGPDQKRDPKKASPEGAARQPEIVVKVAPKYPEEARKIGASAKIYLKMTVDETGKVVMALADSMVARDGKGEILKGDAGKRLLALFERSATDAAKQWKFKPAADEGEPDTLEVMVPIEFKLH